MQVHSTVLLSISDFQTRAPGLSFSCVLFGKESKADYCYLLGANVDQAESQIHEYYGLTNTIDPAIELLGFGFVGHGLDPANIDVTLHRYMSLGSYILLVDLSDPEKAACQAFHNARPSAIGSSHVQWTPIPLQLVSDQAAAIAIAASIQPTSASDMYRAKHQLKSKIKQLRLQLETTQDDAEISSLVVIYGQLKKLHFASSLDDEDIDLEGDGNVLCELIAKVIAKSDERHKHLTANTLNYNPAFL